MADGITVRKCFGYAFATIRPHTGKWWFVPVGGVIAWAIVVVVFRFPVVDLLPHNELLKGAIEIVICVVAAYIILFLGVLCWAPFHFRLKPRGGLKAVLQNKLGSQMWPTILMFFGLVAFIGLFGAGVILFVGNANKEASAPPDPRIGLMFRAQQLTLFKTDFDGIVRMLRARSPQILSTRKNEILASERKNAAHLQSDAEVMWDGEIKTLEEKCSRFWGEAISIKSPEPSPSVLANPVPGDEDISNNDDRMKYRILWWKLENARLALNKVERRLNGEISSVNERIRDTN